MHEIYIFYLTVETKIQRQRKQRHHWKQKVLLKACYKSGRLAILKDALRIQIHWLFTSIAPPQQVRNHEYYGPEHFCPTHPV